MDTTNKRAPGARGIPQPFNRQPGHALQSKPVAAQLKTGVSAQRVKPPVNQVVPSPQTTTTTTTTINNNQRSGPPTNSPSPDPTGKTLSWAQIVEKNKK